MSPITNLTKPIALEILKSVFQTSPNIRWIINDDKNFEVKLSALCEYALDINLARDGAFISEDLNGVALVYDSRTRIPMIKDLCLKLKLVMNCIGWLRVLKILWNQEKLARLRPKDPHIYFFMLGVKKGSPLTTVVELKKGIFQLSKALNLPILAETAMEKNKVVYERFGFTNYNTFKPNKETFTLWLMKRPNVG